MSRIDCGTLSPVRANGIEFQGPVRLGDRLDGELILKKHGNAGSSGTHPDYTVEYAPTGGRPRQIGAAWQKNGVRVADFLSMTLDDPDWSSPLNLSAFPPQAERGGSAWTLVWSRPRGARVQDEAQNGKSA